MVWDAGLQNHLSRTNSLCLTIHYFVKNLNKYFLVVNKSIQIVVNNSSNNLFKFRKSKKNTKVFAKINNSFLINI